MSGTRRAEPERRAESAKGANAATSGRRPAEVVGAPRTSVELRAHLAVAVDDALGRSGRSGGEEDRAVGVGTGLRGQAAVPPDAAPGSSRSCGDPSAGGPLRGRGRRRSASPAVPSRAAATRPGRPADDVVERGTAQGAAHAGEAEPLVGDHDDRAGAPRRIHHRGEVGRRAATRRATRSPGRTPAAASPRGELVDPRPASCQLTTLPATDITGPGVAARGARARDQSVVRSLTPVGADGWRHVGAAGRQVAQPGGHRSGVLRVRPRAPGGRRPRSGAAGVRQPVAQVGAGTLAEDRVARAPEQQRGHVEPADAVGELGDGAPARMARGERDVGDEVADGRRRPAVP